MAPKGQRCKAGSNLLQEHEPVVSGPRTGHVASTPYNKLSASSQSKYHSEAWKAVGSKHPFNYVLRQNCRDQSNLLPQSSCFDCLLICHMQHGLGFRLPLPGSHPVETHLQRPLCDPCVCRSALPASSCRGGRSKGLQGGAPKSEGNVKILKPRALCIAPASGKQASLLRFVSLKPLSLTFTQLISS